MSTPTAFDEAVKGASGVSHTASTLVFAVENNERDLIQPAIFGTLNVLETVTKHNASIRHVVNVRDLRAYALALRSGR
jgi:hypothetical protein